MNSYLLIFYDQVDVFMLDLDVGFLADPKGIVKNFYETPEIDIFVQVFKIKGVLKFCVFTENMFIIIEN